MIGSDLTARLTFVALSRRGEPPPVLLQAAGWSDPCRLVHCGLYQSALALGDPVSNVQQQSSVLTAYAALAQVEEASCIAVSARRWPEPARVRAALALARLRLHATHPLAQDLPLPIRLAINVAEGACPLLEEPRIDTPDTAFLTASMRTALGDYRAARAACNTGFRLAGMLPVVDEGRQAPMSLDSFLLPPAKVETQGPLVSVVVAARNASGTIGAAIRSLLGQTWRNIEIVLVDDFSSDQTAQAALDAAADDPRFVIVPLPCQAGPYAARNIGVSLARGELVTFNDADDVALPERITIQAEALLRQGFRASLARLVRLDEDGRFVAPRVWPFVRLNPSSVMMHRALCAQVGPFREDELGADGEYLARMALMTGGRAIARLAHPATVASQRSDSLTGSKASGLSTREGARRRTAFVERWVREHAAMLSQTGRRAGWLPLSAHIPPLPKEAAGCSDGWREPPTKH